MSLPKIDVPVYEIKLISTGKIVKIRPFLVKEQKLFLMASESEDPKETIRVIRQVLKNCIIDELDIAIYLPLTSNGYSYIFVLIR